MSKRSKRQRKKLNVLRRQVKHERKEGAKAQSQWYRDNLAIERRAATAERRVHELEKKIGDKGLEAFRVAIRSAEPFGRFANYWQVVVNVDMRALEVAHFWAAGDRFTEIDRHCRYIAEDVSRKIVNAFMEMAQDPEAFRKKHAGGLVGR